METELYVVEVDGEDLPEPYETWDLAMDAAVLYKNWKIYFVQFTETDRQLGESSNV